MVYFFNISPELGRQISEKMMVFTDIKAIVEAGIDCQLEPFWDPKYGSLKIVLIIGNGRVTRSNICFHVFNVVAKQGDFDPDRGFEVIWYPVPGQDIVVF